MHRLVNRRSMPSCTACPPGFAAAHVCMCEACPFARVANEGGLKIDCRQLCVGSNPTAVRLHSHQQQQGAKSRCFLSRFAAASGRAVQPVNIASFPIARSSSSQCFSLGTLPQLPSAAHCSSPSAHAAPVAPPLADLRSLSSNRLSPCVALRSPPVRTFPAFVMPGFASGQQRRYLTNKLNGHTGD